MKGFLTKPHLVKLKQQLKKKQSSAKNSPCTNIKRGSLDFTKEKTKRKNDQVYSRHDKSSEQLGIAAERGSLRKLSQNSKKVMKKSSKQFSNKMKKVLKEAILPEIATTISSIDVNKNIGGKVAQKVSENGKLDKRLKVKKDILKTSPNKMKSFENNCINSIESNESMKKNSAKKIVKEMSENGRLRMEGKKRSVNLVENTESNITPKRVKNIQDQGNHLHQQHKTRRSSDGGKNKHEDSVIEGKQQSKMKRFSEGWKSIKPVESDIQEKQQGKARRLSEIEQTLKPDNNIQGKKQGKARRLSETKKIIKHENSDIQEKQHGKAREFSEFGKTLTPEDSNIQVKKQSKARRFSETEKTIKPEYSNREKQKQPKTRLSDVNMKHKLCYICKEPSHVAFRCPREHRTQGDTQQKQHFADKLQADISQQSPGNLQRLHKNSNKQEQKDKDEISSHQSGSLQKQQENSDTFSNKMINNKSSANVISQSKSLTENGIEFNEGHMITTKSKVSKQIGKHEGKAKQLDRKMRVLGSKKSKSRIVLDKKMKPRLIIDRKMKSKFLVNKMKPRNKLDIEIKPKKNLIKDPPVKIFMQGNEIIVVKFKDAQMTDSDIQKIKKLSNMIKNKVCSD